MCSNVVFDRLNKQKKIQANLNFSWSTVPSTMLNQCVKIVFSALSTLFALAVLSVLCAIVQCNCAIVQLHCLILEICLTLWNFWNETFISFGVQAYQSKERKANKVFWQSQLNWSKAIVKFGKKRWNTIKIVKVGCNSEICKLLINESLNGKGGHRAATAAKYRATVAKPITSFLFLFGLTISWLSLNWLVQELIYCCEKIIKK